MLVRGVVGHQIEQQLEAMAVRCIKQRVEIGQRAEQRIDRAVIGDVVAEIGHGRDEDRRQPDGVNTEVGEIRQARNDARKIANAVAVGVLERARINLVENAGLPPVHALGPKRRFLNRV